jgi:hypothetical protein
MKKEQARPSAATNIEDAIIGPEAKILTQGNPLTETGSEVEFRI